MLKTENFVKSYLLDSGGVAVLAETCRSGCSALFLVGAVGAGWTSRFPRPHEIR